MPPKPDFCAMVFVDDLVSAVDNCRILRKQKTTTSPRLPNKSMIELHAGPGRLGCRLCDRRCGIEVSIVNDGDDPGFVTVDVEILYKALKAFSGATTMTVAAGGSRLKIEGQGAFYVELPLIEIFDKDDDGDPVRHAWPEWPSSDAFSRIGAENNLGGILRGVVPFASTDDHRVNLNSVRVGHDGRKLVAVTTDGHRMAIREHKFDLPKIEVRGANRTQDHILLPPEVVPLLLPNQTVRMSHSEDTAFFKTSNLRSRGPLPIRIWATLQRVTFPPYDAVVPRYFTGEVNGIYVKRADLEPVLKSFRGLFYNLGAPLQLAAKGTTLTLRHPERSSEEAATVFAEIPCRGRCPEGPVTVNPTYAHEALQVTSAHEILLCWEGHDDPVVVSNERRTEYVILMPVRFG